MLINAPLEVPDWQAINAAHRLVEAERPLEDTARPVGSVSLAVMFEQVEADAFLPQPVLRALPQVPRRSNGFGRRNQTNRAAAYKTNGGESHFEPLQVELERLTAVRQDVEQEIDYPRRTFFTWKETENAWGEVRPEKDYIFDPEQIEEIKAQERAALEVVVNALRVGVFEKHPRTRGFPGTRRVQDAEEVYHNVAHLRSSHCKHSSNPLVQAMLDDLENRLTHWHPVDAEADFYGRRFSAPDWLDTYMPSRRH